MATRSFTVTEDHLKLLKAMYIGWEHCEYGAPAVDCKRPYGNSDVPHDIANELGWEWPDEDDEDFDYGDLEDMRVAARVIHEQMQTVLQILVRNLGIAEGTYVCEGYGEDWRKA